MKSKAPGRLMAASNGWKNLLVQIYSGPRGRAIGPESFATMHLYLGLPVFNRATEEAFQKPGATHLRDLSGFKGNFLSALLEGLHKELSSRHRGSSLFVEGIAQSLAGHLVRTYADETTQDYKADYRGSGR